MLPGKSISFVIPMYNESGAIEDTVERLTEVAKELTDDYEIIVSNDASTDNSGAIVDKISKNDSHVKVEHLEKNTKFGGALKAGIYRARKDIIVYTDSDFPIRPEDIREALLLLRECDMVTAYSKIKKGETLKRVIMSKVYNFLIQSLFNTNIKDINSGFKIFKRKVFRDMRLISGSPFIDVEIFVRAMKKNFTVKQYPIIFRHREYGKSHISRAPVILRTMADMLRFKFSCKL